MIGIIIVMLEVEKGFFWLRLMMRGGGRELSSRRGIKKLLLTTPYSILFLLLSSCLTPPGVPRQKSCAQAQYLVMVAALPCRRYVDTNHFDW